MILWLLFIVACIVFVWLNPAQWTKIVSTVLLVLTLFMFSFLYSKTLYTSSVSTDLDVYELIVDTRLSTDRFSFCYEYSYNETIIDCMAKEYLSLWNSVLDFVTKYNE